MSRCGRCARSSADTAPPTSTPSWPVPRMSCARPGVGCVARAVVFVLVGVFLLKAAVLSSAKQVKGLDAVFRSVTSSAYGSWLLAALASGLLRYGFYCLLEARYRDLTPGR